MEVNINITLELYPKKESVSRQKFQLEQAMMNIDTIDAIEGAQVHIKTRRSTTRSWNK